MERQRCALAPRPIALCLEDVASGVATVNADGMLTASFTIPATISGVPLRGDSFSILVRARGSGCCGFNFVTNPRL
ncbi:MAG: hypothetical protein J7551_03125 [Chloroflexi bacterium]|nr:hypothetical protein [Chloroflexota bacterium]